MMRRLPVALALVIWGGLLWPLSQRAATLPALPTTFRIVTFNIHKGADLHTYDLERTIEAISRLNPDIVGVQEAMRNHPDFNCDDQPALIAAGLSRRSGHTWTHVFEKAWITDHKKCLESGRGDDTESEGLALFAHEPIVSSNAIRLSQGRVGLAIRVASMPALPIIVTHLSANQSGQADREREIARLLPWAARQGPGILIGDLNARPDTSELQPIMSSYRDSWAEALAQGRAGGVMTGSTRPGRRVSRIDYVFYKPDAPVVLESVDIVDTATFPGLGVVSDHHPVLATFRERSLD